MSGGAAEFPAGIDLEAMLSDVLRPIDPPDGLGVRVEETLSRVAQAAAAELSGFADELTAGESEALRDPRNWVRPAAAAGAGAVAGAALLLFGTRSRNRRRLIADQIGAQLDELRGKLTD